MNITEIKISDCVPFPENPFHVKDGEEMEMLKDSIADGGILNPIVVRPTSDGKYEIISGHRRAFACRELGIATVPAIIKEYSQDEAIIAMVDSNLQRDGLLPSEKAYAYRMKLEAMKHQGRTSDQDGPKLTTALIGGKDDSSTQVKRFIRLTYLAKPLLDLVDEKKIALTPAVELSYLTPEEQGVVLDAIKYYDCTPSYSQTVRLHRYSEHGELDNDMIYDIISEEKANQREKISLDSATLRRYFPKEYSTSDIIRAIIQILEEQKNQQQATQQNSKRRNCRDER